MEKRIYIVLLTGLMLLSCSPRALHEAQGVVAQADSLRAEGRMYDDSLALAQAYGTLGQWQWFYADDYAHACYHYGRLLREKDNPVEAMQCFINASHTPTRDYHILGRVYSNMGEIAHLASEYQLSYEMFERTADMFLQAKDSIAYFYALNDMAFELAEQGKKKESLFLLNRIDYSDTILSSLTNLTKAEMYKRNEQYDSAIYCSYALCKNWEHQKTGFLIRAQSYSFLGNKDSAVFYANKVHAISSDLYTMNGALYILTQDDDSKCKEDIRQTSADRSDIHKLIEMQQGKLSQAVQLLEQDLARKPNLTWLYAIIVTLFVVGVSLFIYVHRKHKKQELLAQKLNLLRQATTTMQERHDELETNYMNNHQHILEEIEYKCSVLRNGDKIYTTLAWKNYHKMCSAVDKQFYLLASKLRSKQCLNETEIRLCVLTLLDCGYDQMAELLFRSTTSIGTLKTRVAKKLGTSSKNLRQYLIDNECLK